MVVPRDGGRLQTGTVHDVTLSTIAVQARQGLCLGGGYASFFELRDELVYGFHLRNLYEGANFQPRGRGSTHLSSTNAFGRLRDLDGLQYGSKVDAKVRRCQLLYWLLLRLHDVG